MTINKFGGSEYRTSESDITRAYAHSNFVEKQLPSNLVKQEQLNETQSSMFCQLLAFLIKEKLITVSNLEALETKWKLSINDCYAELVERIDPIIDNNDAGSNVVYINDPNKNS